MVHISCPRCDPHLKHCILLSIIVRLNVCYALVVRQALKLSEDYNLNELHCVGLLVSAHQEVGPILHYPLLLTRHFVSYKFSVTCVNKLQMQPL